MGPGVVGLPIGMTPSEGNDYKTRQLTSEPHHPVLTRLPVGAYVPDAEESVASGSKGFPGSGSGSGSDPQLDRCMARLLIAASASSMLQGREPQYQEAAVPSLSLQSSKMTDGWSDDVDQNSVDRRLALAVISHDVAPDTSERPWQADGDGDRGSSCPSHQCKAMTKRKALLLNERPTSKES